MSQGFVNSGFNAKCAGDVIQVQRFETGAVSTGTTAIPDDDTIPQNTEGDQYMTVSITPTNVNSTLKIDVAVSGSCSAENKFMAALFQDSTANALAVGFGGGTNGNGQQASFTHYMTAGTTSSTTFKVRAASSTGTFTFNGIGGTRRFGGVMASSITVTEIASGTLIREAGSNIAGNIAVAKAWVVFNGTGTPAIGASYNISSITDNGTGDYTINFTTPFSSANYAMAGFGIDSSGGGAQVIVYGNTAPSASSLRIKTVNAGGALLDCQTVSVIFFGNQ